MTDFKKEWMFKADVDYFSPFISLWLACNSWYNSHYSEISGADRNFINILKTDITGRNQLYTKFVQILNMNDKESTKLKTNIELLHYSLQRANLKPDRVSACSLEKAIISYNRPRTEVDLIKRVTLTSKGKLKKSYIGTVIKLDQLYVTNNIQHLFAGIFEIIYQIRNMIIHGKMKPEKDEHDVVKYCYMILWQLMN